MMQIFFIFCGPSLRRILQPFSKNILENNLFMTTWQSLLVAWSDILGNKRVTNLLTQKQKEKK
jgi:hypothetical protein